MRSAIIAAAAFAATVLAVPYEKRAVVTNTDVEMVYVTQMVTVTAGAQPTAEVQPQPEPATQPKANKAHVHHRHHPKKPQWWGRPHKQPHKHKHHHKKPTQEAPAPAPAPTQESEAPTPEPTQPSAPATDYASKAILHHNIHRANHSASDLEWDSDLEASAKMVADSCVYAHNVKAMGGGYGQNIAAGVDAENITAVITNLFYNGEVGWFDGLYGQAQPSMANFEKWGHFSQIVWKGTTHVGCYTKDCSSQGLANTGGHVNPFFTVCNYKSAGNFANQYAKNVGEPLGNPTVDWNYGL